MTDTTTEHNEPDQPAGLGCNEGLGPRAWAIFADNGNTRMWNTMQPHLQSFADEHGLTVTPLYDAATVRKMLEGAWVAGYYDAGYTHDSAYACAQAEKCADEFLGPNVPVKPGP